MNKYNIAVIDSGINLGEVYKQDCKIFCVYSCIENDFNDYLGHGTNIINTILMHESQINIFIFKIFNKNLECNLDSLIKALNIICKEYPFINIINMSLGINKDNDILKNICSKLYKQNILLVSAYNNKDGIDSYPATYSFVYGIKGSMYKNEYEYYVDSENNVTIYGYLPYELSKKTHIFNKANSFAAAHFSGVLASLYDTKTSIKQNSIHKERFSEYLNSIGNFNWINRAIILNEDQEVYNERIWKDPYYKIVGYCKLINDNYKVINFNSEMSMKESYDTLLVDDYNLKHQQSIVEFIFYNLTIGKNVFCKMGFDKNTNSLLQKLAQEMGNIFYIKYVC